MAEEIDFENGRNSKFEGLVTLTLTFDPAIRHIVLQQSSTSTYIPTFIQIEETFCGRTDVRTYGRTDVRTDGRTDIFPLYTIRSTFGSRPKKYMLQFAVLPTSEFVYIITNLMHHFAGPPRFLPHHIWELQPFKMSLFLAILYFLHCLHYFE